MPYKKIVKIFIGSSLEEFREERRDIENFIYHISSNIFEETYDIKVKPLLCENEDTAMTEDRKQDVFNNLVRGSDMCFFIFYTRAGQFTVEEMDKAYEYFKGSENKKPRVYVYFKRVPSGISVDVSVNELMEKIDKVYKQYYGTFEHVDTLKLRIFLNLVEQEMKDCNIRQEIETVYGDNGESPVFNLKLNGKKVLELNDISEFANSAELKKLQDELERIEKCYFEMLPRYSKGGEDGEFYKEYADVAAKRQHLKDVIEELSKRLFDLSLNLSRDEVNGEMTYRQKEAYRLLSLGDSEACLAVLNEKDIDDEDKRAGELLEAQGIARHTKFIHEHRFAINVLLTAISYKERFEEIERRYEKIVERAEKTGVEIDVLYDYAVYLYNQKNFPHAIEVAQRLQKLYDKNRTEVSNHNQGSLLNLLGIILGSNNDLNAEDCFKRALEIGERLAAENPAVYEPDLARTYNNLGIFYRVNHDSKQAELYHKRALEIGERLAAENPAVYEPDLASTYRNLGVFYKNNHDPEQAEIYYKRALEIYEKFAKENPAAYEPGLASTLNSLGNFYSDNHDPEQVEIYYKRALEIYEKFAKENPAAYEPDLASTYNNLGVFYTDNNDSEQAELYHKRALEIRERLATENPAAYEPDLASTYNNLGVFYTDNNDSEQAEINYKCTLEIYEKLAKENSETYEPYLAMTCYNLGNFYSDKNDSEQAEIYYKRALEIRVRLSVKNPAAYEPDLASTYNNLGVLYFERKNLENAEKYIKRSLEIYGRLAKENPAAYESELAMTCNNLGEFYKENHDLKKSEIYYGRALEIYYRLATENPTVYEPKLADSLFNYALLFIEKDVEMARGYMQRAKGIAEKYVDIVPSCAEICKKIDEKLSADDN